MTVMSEARKEQLQMSGWASGRRGDSTCYQNVNWNAEERKVFRKAYNNGLAMLRIIGHK